MNPFDIYNARIFWGNCPDMRPWLIVEALPDDLFHCFPIASEKYRSRQCFFLHDEHPDFRFTGLTKSCYIHHEVFVAIRRDRLSRRRGDLRGNLLQEFKFFADL